MKRWQLIKILLVILWFSLYGTGYTLNIPDDEWDITIGTPNLDYCDLRFLLPAYGMFSTGTTGWSIVTSGGGRVNNYTGAVGLCCQSAQTAGIEFGPISVSTAAGLSLDWDMLGAGIKYQGSNETTATDSTYQIAGRFWVEFYDVDGRPYAPRVIFDCGSNNVINCFGMGMGGNTEIPTATFTWQFSVPHQTWYKISKVRIMYAVPANAGNRTTEIKVYQLYLASMLNRLYSKP